MDWLGNGKESSQVARMRYKPSRAKRTDGKGQAIFRVTLGLTVAIVTLFLVLSPPAFGDLTCEKDDGKGCGCPADTEDIGMRHVLVIDATDQLRNGKFDDIEQLISSMGTTPQPIWSWLVSGKKTAMTSVFVLANSPPAEMQPVAKFCSPPPKFAQLIGFKDQEINTLMKSMKARTQRAVEDLRATSPATQSPIVETLATVVRSASHWAPGSTLVLASDLIENSPACGYFENLPAAPALSSISAACDSQVRTFQEGLRPTAAYPRTSVVALCTLPGKQDKAGLRKFWSDIVKGALNSDALYSCDPAEIQQRRDFLTKR
jgi:hypothetical protein